MGLRYFQAVVAEHPEFRRAVLASAMKVAYEVLTDTVPDPQNGPKRKRAAITMYGDIGSNRERLIELFSWYAIFKPELQAVAVEVVNNTVVVHPDRIDDSMLDGIIREFWTSASQIVAENAP